jgi:hypothetical protein
MAKLTRINPTGTYVTFDLPPGPPPANHGKTSAAWITVLVIMVGGLIATIGMIFASIPLTIAGSAVLVLGLVVGRVMRAMGLGQPRASAPQTPHSTSSPRS